MMSRRQYFIKTKHKRRKHPPPVLHKESEAVSESSAAAVPPPLPQSAAKPRRTWLDHAKSSAKLAVAVLVAGYGIYFLATSQAGRSIYPEQSANPSFALPSHPGHRGASASQHQAGAMIEHSLADRLPPTDQSFRDTFGNSRNIGAGRSGTVNAGETEVLPEKVKLREDLAGECEVGSNGRFDIEKCLRRHSVAGN